MSIEQKIRNTVLNNVTINNSLDNSNILVTHVAVGFANITQVDSNTTASDNFVYSSLPTDYSKPETGTLLLLPDGACITRVMLFKPVDSKLDNVTGGKFAIYRDKFDSSLNDISSLNGTPIAVSSDFDSNNKIPKFPQTFVANKDTFNGIKIETDSKPDFVKQRIKCLTGTGTQITPGVLGIKYEYVML